MWKRFGIIATMACLVSAAAWADSILIDGKVYTNVKVYESGSRYYVRLPDGSSISVAKDQIQKGDLVRGDGPPPKPRETPPPAPEPVPAPEPEPVPEPTPPPAPEPVPAPEPEPFPEPTPPPAPEPVPAPEPEPVPEPTPPPAPEPVPAPEPEPIPEPTPPPAPEPVPEPEPEPIPEPTPPPAPEPVPAPEPEPIPEPTPPPTPEPVPAPEPEPIPEPTPLPAPEPVPEPEQEPIPEPTSPPAPEPEPLYEFILDNDAPAALHAGSTQVAITHPKRPVSATALVLEAGGVSVAFCVVEAPAVDGVFSAAVAERLAAQGSRITRPQLFLSAAGAGEAGLLRNPLFSGAAGPRFNEEFFLNTANAAAQAVLAAEAALAPAVLRMGEMEAPALQSLRGNGSSTADSTLSVLCLESPDGGPIAHLVNYALLPPPGRDSAAPAVAMDTLRERLPGNVLFFNGAAGDVTPNAEAGDIAEALAEAAMSAIAEAAPRGALAVRLYAHEALSPPSLAGALFPEKVLVQELRMDDAVLLAMPGYPAAQIGLLLRAKAMAAGAEHVFLLAAAGECLGFHPTIEEYFAVTDAARGAWHGPLMVKWYGETLRAFDDEPDALWASATALGRYAAAFQAAIARGERDRRELHEAWVQAAPAVDALAAKLGADAQAPDATDARALWARQRLALHFRQELADFTEEQRVMLMGVAEGAALPFDAALVMQILTRPDRIPAALTEGVAAMNVLNVPDLLAHR